MPGADIRSGALVVLSVLATLSCSGSDGGPTDPNPNPNPNPDPEVGDVRVATATSGADLDADGYQVAVGESPARSIGANGIVTITDVSAGTHQVELAGIADNCAVSGENPVAVGVSDGTLTDVAFGLTCQEIAPPPPAGTIRVTTVSGGGGPYPSGYSVSVGGETPLSIAIAGTRTFGGLAPGDHEVLLGGLADNCQVQGDNPLTIPVVVDSTSDAAFEVACLKAMDLWIVNADGSGETRLTDHPLQEVLPVWSPDGTRVAYLSNRNGAWHVHTIGADGSGDFQVTAEPTVYGWKTFIPEWSPDGSRIVFARGPLGEPYDLYSINSDGTNERKLTNDPGWYERRSFSPDGTRIAFIRERNGTYSLYVMGDDGSGLTQLVADLGSASGGVDWSDDGARLLFPCDVNVCVVNADGSSLVQLTDLSDRHGAWLPIWSPDETQILFMSGIWNGWTYMGHSQLIDADGSNLVLITDSQDVPHTDHSWSPDGEWIYFLREMNVPSLDNDLWRIRKDGSEESNLTPNPQSDNDFDVSPDGSRIVLGRTEL